MLTRIPSDIGKLMNGYGTNNWANSPKGWDHFDGLVRDVPHSMDKTRAHARIHTSSILIPISTTRLFSRRMVRCACRLWELV